MKNLIFLFTTLFSISLPAQVELPAPSPKSQLSQDVGLMNIEISYSRPGVKNRSIFAIDGLVPFDKIWRTGANAVTKITISDPILIENQTLEKGSYAILTTPNTKTWKVQFYPFEKNSWSSYKEKNPTLIYNAPTSHLDHKTETFTIDINNIKNNSASILMVWDNTLVEIPFAVNTDKKVLAGIDKAMNGPTDNEYYNAGVYYFESGKDINQAYEWVHKANEMTSENPKFWRLRKEALILAKMENYIDAIRVASQSRDLASNAGNDEYVRLNTKSIEKWTNAESKRSLRNKVNKKSKSPEKAKM